jgi:protein TonB
MQEAATSVLIDRSRASDGLARTWVVSLLLHTTAALLLVVVPAPWRELETRGRPAVVMTVSLAGAPGPRAGGMTPLGGRPIQEAAPLPPARRPEPLRPPAPRRPEGILPGRVASAPASPPTTAPEPRGRTPVRGEEVRPGSAVAETGGRGFGFGLTTGGGGGTGGYLEVGEFCCPEYLATMLDLIRKNWDARQRVTGETTVKFTILREGRIVGAEVERSSGFLALDLAALRAVNLTRLPPLPAAFPDPQLVVHLNFQYQP